MKLRLSECTRYFGKTFTKSLKSKKKGNDVIAKYCAAALGKIGCVRMLVRDRRTSRIKVLFDPVEINRDTIEKYSS